MADNEVKPEKEPNGPKATPDNTKIGEVLIGAIIGAVSAVLAMLLFWQFTRWVPDSGEVASSTYFRNGLLGIAAFAGLAVAIWRGRQTDQQIKQTQEQLELTQKQIEQTKEQFQLSSNASFQQNDRDTFREAAKLLSDSDDAVRLAGISLLENLEKMGPFQRQTRKLLDELTMKEKNFDGRNFVHQALASRFCETESPATFNGTNFKAISFGPKAPSSVGPIFFYRCTIEDCALVPKHNMVGTVDEPLLTCTLERSYIAKGNSFVGSALLNSCLIDTSEIYFSAEYLRFRNCVFLALTDRIVADFVKGRVDAKNCYVIGDRLTLPPKGWTRSVHFKTLQSPEEAQLIVPEAYQRMVDWQNNRDSSNFAVD